MPNARVSGWPGCGCPSGFTLCAGRCYKLVETKLKRAAAKTSCENMGAHLAVPRSPQENQCVLDLVPAWNPLSLITDPFSPVGTMTAFIGVTKKNGEYEGDDGSCGDVPAKADWWGPLQPSKLDLIFEILFTPLELLGINLDLLCTALGKRSWLIAHCDFALYSVCQLSNCYQPQQC